MTVWIDEDSSSPATGLSLEFDGASPTLVSVECGAGGSKVGTGVLTDDVVVGVGAVIIEYADPLTDGWRRTASSRRCGMMDGATDAAGMIGALHVGESAWRERGIGLWARGGVAKDGVSPRPRGR